MFCSRTNIPDTGVTVRLSVLFQSQQHVGDCGDCVTRRVWEKPSNAKAASSRHREEEACHVPTEQNRPRLQLRKPGAAAGSFLTDAAAVTNPNRRAPGHVSPRLAPRVTHGSLVLGLST